MADEKKQNAKQVLKQVVENKKQKSESGAAENQRQERIPEQIADQLQTSKNERGYQNWRKSEGMAPDTDSQPKPMDTTKGVHKNWDDSY
jgi:hypothetical protein